jgi:hypothetical protein
MHIHIQYMRTYLCTIILVLCHQQYSTMLQLHTKKTPMRYKARTTCTLKQVSHLTGLVDINCMMHCICLMDFQCHNSTVLLPCTQRYLPSWCSSISWHMPDLQTPSALFRWVVLKPKCHTLLHSPQNVCKPLICQGWEASCKAIACRIHYLSVSDLIKKVMPLSKDMMHMLVCVCV